jgi:hypothetical protein
MLRLFSGLAEPQYGQKAISGGFSFIVTEKA